jgi:acetyl esterase
MSESDITEVVMPRPEVAALLSYLSSRSSAGIETRTPQEARHDMLVSVQAADLPIGDIAVEQALEIPTRSGSIAGLLLDARAARLGTSPVVVWFHGGGFVTGGLETHRSFAADAARQLDLPVLLVDYRLAPEHPYPAAVDDAEDAARWAATSPDELSFEVDGLVLGGDSAGGTLAIVTAMELRDRPADVAVDAQLVIYPATDSSRTYPSQEQFATGRLLTEAGRRWYYDHYRADVNDWHGSPLLGDLAGLPPAVVVTAGEDPVRDEGRAYAAALVSHGTPTTFLEADGHIHAFVLLRRAVPSTQDDLRVAFAALVATVHASRARRAVVRQPAGA